MALVVEVQRASDGDGVPPTPMLRAWAQSAWLTTGKKAEVVVRISDEEESRRINDQFRQQDKPTNVLSFAYEHVPGTPHHHVGDLLICAPIVAREALEQGKSSEAHWAHMVVHGMLHLQGYDHVAEADAEAMESLETRILTGLGYPAPYEGTS